METASTITIASLSSVIILGFLKAFFNQKIKFSFRAKVGNESSDSSDNSPQQHHSRRPSRIEPIQNSHI
jgi:hypothetical protein